MSNSAPTCTWTSSLRPPQPWQRGSSENANVLVREYLQRAWT